MITISSKAKFIRGRHGLLESKGRSGNDYQLLSFVRMYYWCSFCYESQPIYAPCMYHLVECDGWDCYDFSKWEVVLFVGAHSICCSCIFQWYSREWKIIHSLYKNICKMTCHYAVDGVLCS